MVTALEALHRLEDLAASGQLDAFADRHGVRLMVAFGSVTDPDRRHAARDLDLAVSWLAHSSRDVVALLAELIDLTGCDAVDVLDLDQADVVARDQALSRGRPLYESTAGLYAREQMRASTMRMDTAWLRRLGLELMAER